MVTFTVHESPSPPADRIDRAEQLAFVRDGFSWTAALLAPIWLLAHRLWWPLAGYIAAEGAIEAIRQTELVHPGWTTLAAIGLGLLIGLEAGTLRRWALDQRGWTTLGAVSGRNAEDCERRFFEMWLPTQPVLAKPAATGDAPGKGSGGGAAGGWRSLLDALSTARS
jgi:uncharacterized protein DUF2628